METAFKELIDQLQSREVQMFLFPVELGFIMVSIVLFGAFCYFVYKEGGLLAKQRKTIADARDYNKNDHGKAVDGKVQKAWKKICDLLKSDSEPEYKLAVIEAETLFSDLLAKMGWEKDNLANQLASIKPGHDSPFDESELSRLASLRNEIVSDKNYKLDLKEVKHLFKELEEEIKRLDK